MGQTGSDPDLAVLDFEQLLARCMGNIDFVERVLSRFQEHFGADLAELEKGLNAADGGQIARVAHRLKGASANVGAAGLRERAAEIEQLGQARRFSEIPSCVDQLRGEWERFVTSATSYGSSVEAAR
jgi:HPt (histidine-containing phosphotransfer) domain-containing protein